MIQLIFKMFVTLGSEWVLGVLMLLSIGILAIAWERGRLMNRIDRDGKNFWDSYVKSWLERGLPAGWASQVQAPANSLESRLVNLVSSDTKKDLASLDVSAEAQMQSEKMRLEKGLSILGTIGNNAPYLGLVGTVIGIIKAFASLASQSHAASSSLNASLAEALVSTAVGIVVALEAVIFYNLFTRKTKLILERASTLKNLLLGGPRG